MAPMAADLSEKPSEAGGPPIKHSLPPATAYPFFSGQHTPMLTPEEEAAPAAISVALGEELAELYNENVAAKLWKVAVELGAQEGGITRYPEHVPADGEHSGRYATREARFWTCGFFPGSLYALLERSIRFPRALGLPTGLSQSCFRKQLLQHCRIWAAPLHSMSHRTNTHDLGFITQPALRTDWELTGNAEAFASLVRAAHNLASRYHPRMRAIRSWDTSFSRRYEITDMKTNFMVIVDSMCNLDLLFYIGHHAQDPKLIDVAIQHARFVAKNLIREDDSTWHVANFDPCDGTVKEKYTHQGYSDTSMWARGQAWTILGFAQTYIWTREPEFLTIATRLADHFIARLDAARYAFPYVPAWDFDAPVDPALLSTATSPVLAPLRDTSAAMIAANGLLLLHAAWLHQSRYLDVARRIARETLDMALHPSRAAFKAAPPAAADISQAEGKAEKAELAVDVRPAAFDAILTHATANMNPFALVRYGDHGLVYADYFFMEFGNKLLRMGLV